MIALLPILTLAALAAPLELADPPGDDRGPGTYLAPSGADYRRGDFDLREVRLEVEGGDLVVSVTLGANLRRDVTTQRQGAADLDLPGGLYVQNVDLYFDVAPGGHTRALPGRRVAFPPEEAWDVAIVLSPQPHRLRGALRRADAELAMDVRVPDGLRARGPTVVARLPLTALPEPPQPHWGLQAVVTGALWEENFEAVERIRGERRGNAYAMPVLGVPEERAFGGARLGEWHPWAVDVLAPEGRTQADILGSWTTGRYARLPMVYPDPEARARQLAAAPPPAVPGPAPGADRPSERDAAPEGPWGLVATVEGDEAVVRLRQGAVRAFELGRVVNDAGTTVGRVVVTHATDALALTKVVEGRGAVQSGARVIFKQNETEERR